jgi:hypothetical protein
MTDAVTSACLSANRDAKRRLLAHHFGKAQAANLDLLQEVVSIWNFSTPGGLFTV